MSARKPVLLTLSMDPRVVRIVGPFIAHQRLGLSTVWNVTHRPTGHGVTANQVLRSLDEAAAWAKVLLTIRPARWWLGVTAKNQSAKIARIRDEASGAWERFEAKRNANGRAA